MEYGLIGERLGHSFSKQIHEALAGYPYTLCEVPDEAAVRTLVRARAFRGINVTIPYKQTVLPLCDVLDESARVIGAVNTIVNRAGVLTGYNTDFAGCRRALRKAGITLADKRVLILGSGGTQKTFLAAARAEGAKSVICVGRTAHAEEKDVEDLPAIASAVARPDAWVTYDSLVGCDKAQVILNATPVGMYPRNGECLVDFAALPQVKAVFDAVYHPFTTELLRRARANGCIAANGLGMLVAQAKYAAELFLQAEPRREIADTEIDRVASLLYAQQGNLVLIGMPGCGKSTLGAAAAAALHKRFIDLDAEIVRRAGKSIPAIFAQDGEEAFRAMESEACAQWGAQTGCVLATGGGAVLRAENVRALRQNGMLAYVRRAPDKLATAGRPLSQGEGATARLYADRAGLYEAAADAIIDNNGSVEAAVQAVTEAYNAAADHQWTQPEPAGRA